MFLVEQKEMAQLTCDCERHIGTQSGGMDQAIHFMLHISNHYLIIFLSNGDLLLLYMV